MSWLKCRCGHIIRDSSDFLSYKGSIIPDQDEDDFFNRTEEMIKSDNPDKNNLICDFLCELAGMTKTVYQCSQCGRLYIENNNELFCFIPENHNNNGVLKSVHGENWKGFLHAEWNDTKYEWQDYKGYVSADVNYPCESIHSDDQNEIIDGYYKLLDKLKKFDVIRHATLRINGKLIHEWDNS
ncbi:MAG: hypothetical protein HDT23_00325 [Ruminococcus sp.]|nr:hypothetical protein [Ruminococcus sp.]